MGDSVTISREEYEDLLKCRQIMVADSEGKYSEQFMKDIKAAEEVYQKGHSVRVKNSQDRKKLFSSL